MLSPKYLQINPCVESINNMQIFVTKELEPTGYLASNLIIMTYINSDFNKTSILPYSLYPLFP